MIEHPVAVPAIEHLVVNSCRRVLEPRPCVRLKRGLETLALPTAKRNCKRQCSVDSQRMISAASTTLPFLQSPDSDELAEAARLLGDSGHAVGRHWGGAGIVGVTSSPHRLDGSASNSKTGRDPGSPFSNFVANAMNQQIENCKVSVRCPTLCAGIHDQCRHSVNNSNTSTISCSCGALPRAQHCILGQMLPQRFVAALFCDKSAAQERLAVDMDSVAANTAEVSATAPTASLAFDVGADALFDDDSDDSDDDSGGSSGASNRNNSAVTTADDEEGRHAEQVCNIGFPAADYGRVSTATHTAPLAFDVGADALFDDEDEDDEGDGDDGDDEDSSSSSGATDMISGAGNNSAVTTADDEEGRHAEQVCNIGFPAADYGRVSTATHTAPLAFDVGADVLFDDEDEDDGDDEDSSGSSSSSGSIKIDQNLQVHTRNTAQQGKALQSCDLRPFDRLSLEARLSWWRCNSMDVDREVITIASAVCERAPYGRLPFDNPLVRSLDL
jgi:hypothetical protein